MENELLIKIDEKPKPLAWFLLSFQHVFAMFGATVLVPILTGMPISVALFASGLGTLLYVVITKMKMPVYLGSSFAYIAAVNIAKNAMGGDISGAQSGLVMVGIVYLIVAMVIKAVGTKWLDKMLPPIVIGPMIIIIGIGMAPVAIGQAGLVAGADWRALVVALVAFGVTVLSTLKGKGFIKIIPFLLGIIAGYLTAYFLGLVDLTPVSEAMAAGLFKVPEFIFPFKVGNFETWNFAFSDVAWSIVPIAFVTISEHIGDHTVLGQICGENFLQDPGLDKSLLGDGVATTVSALIGGPANTTYGENTGVIALTKVGSVWVIMGAAVIAVLLSFISPFAALISTIPDPVLGGMSIILFGVIGSNGLRILIDNKVDFNEQRNLIIASSMLILGLGGAILQFNNFVSLEGMALAGIVGIILNFVLPKTSEKPAKPTIN
ncbi:MAG: uracil permease [Erysipelothrix sp.]|nr:uracil permease [Erysipelothrix sp.]